MPEESAAIDVMTKAANDEGIDLNDPQPKPNYKFTATYFGKDKHGIVLGFFIEAISGIPDLKEG